MDKVKQILEVVKKHHFWILCGLTAIVGLAAWYMSTATLADQFKAGYDKIESTMKTLTALPAEPKVNWTTVAEQQTKAAIENVKSEWETLYKYQKQKVFVWPKELGDDFLKAIAEVEGTNNEIEEKLRERYADRVREATIELATIVDCEPPTTGTNAALAPAPVANPTPVNRHVTWAQLADIQQGFEWERTPSTEMIKQAQEELWVYQALCHVIANVNEGSQGNHDAPIKDIIAMDIAYALAEAPVNGGKNRIPALPGLPTAGAGDAAAGTTGGGETAQPPQKLDVKGRLKSDPAAALPGGAATDGATTNLDSIWKAYRYVKETGEPMQAADVDAAAPSAKFFLMPFRLSLRMDRRSIDRLLVACRNSPLPIEVRQVRVGATAANAGGGAAVAPARVGRSHDEGDGGGPAYVASGNNTYARDSTVEIAGVVYLVQPPNLKPAAADQSAGGDSTDTTATTPPAGENPPANKQ